jgi:hypothetical protein
MLATETPEGCPPLRRSALAGAALAVALACGLAFAPSGARAADPRTNIPLGQMPAACAQETSAECEGWLLERLDAARGQVGLPSYVLPANFLSFSGDKQILILADLDRVAYGHNAIAGLNASLGEAAQGGVRNETDPLPGSGEGWQGFGSDWASTGPLLAYYLWMYDDGYPGPNLDCSSPSGGGCWGHRHVILGEAVSLPQPEVMGVATGQSARGQAGTALIVSSRPTAATYYTWTQAQSEGAGGGSGSGAGAGSPTGNGSSTNSGSGSGSGSGPVRAPGASSASASGSQPGAGEPPSPGAATPATCRRVRGRGEMNISGVLSGAVSDELTTSRAGRQPLEVSISYPAIGLVRLTGLSSATCTVTGTSREFHGQGTASLSGRKGYSISFTFTQTGARWTFSMQLTRRSQLAVRLSDIPLSTSSELIYLADGGAGSAFHRHRLIARKARRARRERARGHRARRRRQSRT